MVNDFKELYKVLTEKFLVMSFFEDGGVGIYDEENTELYATITKKEVEKLKSINELVSLIKKKLS